MIGSKQRIEGLYERRAGALGGVMAFLLFVVTVGLATAPAHATEAPEGYSARAEAKAQALLKIFPRVAGSPSCSTTTSRCSKVCRSGL